jgi:hypothetical protein
LLELFYWMCETIMFWWSNSTLYQLLHTCKIYGLYLNLGSVTRAFFLNLSLTHKHTLTHTLSFIFMSESFWMLGATTYHLGERERGREREREWWRERERDPFGFEKVYDIFSFDIFPYFKNFCLRCRSV